jgi:hypothetical protein
MRQRATVPVEGPLVLGAGLLEIMSDAVVIADEPGLLVDANTHAEELFGASGPWASACTCGWSALLVNGSRSRSA